MLPCISLLLGYQLQANKFSFHSRSSISTIENLEYLSRTNSRDGGVQQCESARDSVLGPRLQ